MLWEKKLIRCVIMVYIKVKVVKFILNCFFYSIENEVGGRMEGIFFV